MRLGTCIALEIALAAGAAGGVGYGAVRAWQLAGDAVPEAGAATLPAVAPLPRSHLRVAFVEMPTVFGASDAELLAPLGAAKVTRVKGNLGGSSLSLRLDFANGARAAFKPEQVFANSTPRREIAAYRIDRLLEIGRVPPAKAVAFSLEELLAAAPPGRRDELAARLRDEAIVRNGVLAGELSWWITALDRARLGRELFVDENEGRARWVSYLQVGARVPAAARPLVEQLAVCVLFDVLIDNSDRWSGNNTLASPDGKVLYIMDNTQSFSLARIGSESSVGALRRIQVFPRALVRRLRGLTEERLVRVLEVGEGAPLGALLFPDEIRAVLQRRDNILKYIDGLIAAHGEEAVLALP